MLTIGHVLVALSGRPFPEQTTTIQKVVIDSRQASTNSLFVAFVGSHINGHEYIENAFQNGAIMALIEQEISIPYPIVDVSQDTDLPALPFCVKVPNTQTALQQVARYWRQQHDVKVIGITGSVGKTSTKELISTVLSERYRTLKSEGNFNNEIGLPLSILRLTSQHECAVLEMGMYAIGEIAELCKIAQPDIGVVTLIAPVHLERLGGMNAIVQAKRELVEALPANGTVILNADDPLVMSMAESTSANLMTYGLTPQADVWADHIITKGLEGIEFNLHYQNTVTPIQTSLLGKHHVYTALSAVAVGLTINLSLPEIVAGLQKPTPSLRLTPLSGLRGSLIIDDTYNASPDSAIAALNFLKDLKGRHIVVLGDMLELGSYEIEAHETVGKMAAQTADLLFLVGHKGIWFKKGALAAEMPAANIYEFTTMSEAISQLAPIIQPKDIVLVKGSRGVQLDRMVKALQIKEGNH